MNAFTAPISRWAFNIRLEPPLAKSDGSTAHTKKRLEKAFVLFLNKSMKQTVDVTNYISIFKRSVSFETRTLSNTIHINKLQMD